MSKEFIPRPYQRQILSHVVNHKRTAVWCGMGMGKTVSTLVALRAMSWYEPEPVFPALVIAPLRVAVSTWPDEIRKWAILDDLKVVTITGKEPERIRALQTKADIYTVNYDNLPWLVDACKSLGLGWPFTTVVADEATRLKGLRLKQGTKRAKALMSVAMREGTRFIELTGTPAPNGLLDLWGQLYFIDKGARLGRTFSMFRERFFRPQQVSDDARAVKWVPYSWAQKYIEDLLKGVCISLKAEDYFDIEEPIKSTIYVNLPDKSLSIYKKLQDEMVADLGEGDTVEAVNAAAKTLKCLQAANGAVYVDGKDGEYKVIHDEKIKALDSIIAEAAGMPVLVAYNFKSDLDRLRKAFPHARVLDKDPKTIRDWNEGKIPILLAHPASAGHGLNLQDGGNILVIFGHDWNLEYYQQIIERIGPTRQAQAGHPRAVFIYHIVAKGTVDEIVMRRRETKREVQDLLLEAMKKEAA